MKRVKKQENFFTLETADRALETDLLCDQCGNQECSLRLIINRVRINRFNAKLNVTRCESFVPILTFRDDAGLAGEFNTFRAGAAWVDRVGPGDLVALQSTAGAFIGYAKVRQSHVGTFEEMDKRFGSDNHLAIDAAVSGKELFSLFDIMIQSYGKNRFSAKSNVSVIELRRLDGNEEEGEAGLRRVC
jgi:hypothetical protein